MMTSDRQALASRIHAVSNIKGAFRLRSGAVSTEYFDKYLFESDPILLRDIAAHMKDLLPTNVDALAGLELGGIAIAVMLSQITGIPALFVRKEAKTYGTCKLVEGGEVRGRHVVVVEDVVTSGGQILLSTAALRDLGAAVDTVLCVIDRASGGRANLAKEGLELRPLFMLAELKAAARWQ